MISARTFITHKGPKKNKNADIELDKIEDKMPMGQERNLGCSDNYVLSEIGRRINPIVFRNIMACYHNNGKVENAEWVRY